jgi:hypothetical protein
MFCWRWWISLFGILLSYNIGKSGTFINIFYYLIHFFFLWNDYGELYSCHWRKDRVKVGYLKTFKNFSFTVWRNFGIWLKIPRKRSYNESGIKLATYEMRKRKKFSWFSFSNLFILQSMFLAKMLCEILIQYSIKYCLAHFFFLQTITTNRYKLCRMKFCTVFLTDANFAV